MYSFSARDSKVCSHLFTQILCTRISYNSLRQSISFSKTPHRSQQLHCYFNRFPSKQIICFLVRNKGYLTSEERFCLFVCLFCNCEWPVRPTWSFQKWKKENPSRVKYYLFYCIYLCIYYLSIPLSSSSFYFYFMLHKSQLAMYYFDFSYCRPCFFFICYL